VNRQQVLDKAQGQARGASRDEEKKGTDSQEFVKKEEKELLEVVREQAAKKEEDEAKKKRENPRKPFNLQGPQIITALALTPDEKYVIASVTEPGTGTKTTIVPNFVTESGYTEDNPFAATKSVTIRIASAWQF